MPNLIYNVEFKIDKSQLSGLKDIIDASTTAEVSSLTEKVKQLEAQLDKLKNTQTGVSKTDQQRIKQSATRASQLDALVKRAKEQKKLTKDELKSLKNLISAEKEEGKVLITNSLNEKKSLTSRKRLADQFKRSSTAVANATEVLEAFENQQEKTNQTVLNGDKSFSIANQTLFGFGDLAQDAAQFSQGAAQGFRAIGNNIAFNAEMFGLLVQKTGSAKEAFKTLGSQIFGTGGIILGINVLITAVTAGLTKFGKSSKEASSALDDFISSSADLRGVSEFDFLNIDSLQRQQKALSSLIPVIEDIDEAESSLSNTNIILGRSYGAAASSALGTKDALVDQSAIIDKLKGKFGDLSDIELASLQEKMTDLNAELALRKALFEADPLAQFISSTSKATQKTLLFSDAGLAANNTLKTRKEDLEKLIQTELDSKEITDESIIRLKFLQDQLQAVTSELKKQNDELFRRNQFIDDTKLMLGENALLQEQIKNIDKLDKREEISLRAKKERLKIEFQSKAEQRKLENQFANDEITESQKNSRIRAIIAQEDLNLLRVDAEEKASNAQLTRDNISEGLQMAANFTSGFSSLKNQEINAEIQAAKARGASAKEIEKLERKKFETNKKAQLANAIINTAANVVEAKPPSPKAIAAGVLGAIQIATILKTKFGGGSGAAAGSGRSGGGSSSAPQNLLSISGAERQTRLNRSLFQGDNDFRPSASGTSGGPMSVNVINTFNDRTVASVSRSGNEARREGAVSGL